MAGREKVMRGLIQVTSRVYFYNPGYYGDIGTQGRSDTKTKDSNREQLEMFADNI